MFEWFIVWWPMTHDPGYDYVRILTRLSRRILSAQVTNVIMMSAEFKEDRGRDDEIGRFKYIIKFTLALHCIALALTPRDLNSLLWDLWLLRCSVLRMLQFSWYFCRPYCGAAWYSLTGLPRTCRRTVRQAVRQSVRQYTGQTKRMSSHNLSRITRVKDAMITL